MESCTLFYCFTFSVLHFTVFLLLLYMRNAVVAMTEREIWFNDTSHYKTQINKTNWRPNNDKGRRKTKAKITINFHPTPSKDEFYMRMCCLSTSAFFCLRCRQVPGRLNRGIRAKYQSAPMPLFVSWSLRKQTRRPWNGQLNDRQRKTVAYDRVLSGQPGTEGSVNTHWLHVDSRTCCPQ